MAETSYSSVKRSLGDAVRARFWYREFREIVLVFAIHNIEQLCEPLRSPRHPPIQHSSFRLSQCELTDFTPSGGAVQPAHAAGSAASDTTTTTIDRIKH